MLIMQNYNLLTIWKSTISPAVVNDKKLKSEAVIGKNMLGRVSAGESYHHLLDPTKL